MDQNRKYPSGRVLEVTAEAASLLALLAQSSRLAIDLELNHIRVFCHSWKSVAPVELPEVCPHSVSLCCSVYVCVQCISCLCVCVAAEICPTGFKPPGSSLEGVFSPLSLSLASHRLTRTCVSPSVSRACDGSTCCSLGTPLVGATCTSFEFHGHASLFMFLLLEQLVSLCWCRVRPDRTRSRLRSPDQVNPNLVLLP